MRSVSVLLFLLACLLLLAVPGVSRAEDEGAAPEPKPGARGGGGRGEGRGRGGGGEGRGARMLKRFKEMDVNGDGEISKDEFQGPARMRERFDQNGDGIISKDEIAARSGNRRGGGASGRRGDGGLSLDKVDTSGDKRVSKSEMDAWFAQADQNGDGFVDVAEWESASSGRRLVDSAPAVGSLAPAVQAKMLGVDKMRDLSKVARTTVMIFGSHT